MEHTSSPKRPYLLRAYYDWLVDNDFTPYLVVDANYYGVVVPQEYVKDGQIVLNISAGAVGNLSLHNQAIEFNARFQGVSRDIYVPMGAVLAIYARENGDGVMFEPELFYQNEMIATEHSSTNLHKTIQKQTTSNKKTKSASHLKIVK